MNGNDGDYILDGGNNNDAMNGGNGIDTADYSARAVTVTVTTGDATANDGSTNVDAATGTGPAVNNVALDVENVLGGSAADSLSGADLVNNVLTGNGGGDTLNGLSGDDNAERQRWQ